MPSRKQLIYCDLLRRGLPWLRSVQGLRFWHRKHRQGLYAETEFLHNLYVSLLEPEFVAHDIWFLNHQARWYLQNANLTYCPNLDANRAAIQELFHLVPEHMRAELEWDGPAPSA